MKMKKWRVSLDRPGSGWTTIIEADSKAQAMAIAWMQYRENPDTAYEVSDRDILSQALVELDREHQSAMDKLLEKHNDKVNKLMRDQAKERARLILA
jgi:hypothetical protein